jgi:hypothetical protein
VAIVIMLMGITMALVEVLNIPDSDIVMYSEELEL